jgi:hypothetical protein
MIKTIYFWVENHTIGYLVQLFCNHKYITETRPYAPMGIRFCSKCGKEPR